MKLRVARDKREVLERLPLVSFQNKMDTKVCRAYTLINLGENQVRKALSPLLNLHKKNIPLNLLFVA